MAQPGAIQARQSRSRLSPLPGLKPSTRPQALFGHARRRCTRAQEEAAWALATLSAEAQYGRALAAEEGTFSLVLDLLAPKSLAQLTSLQPHP